MIIFFQLIICIFISSFGKNLENIFFYYGFLATVTLGLSRLRAVAEHGQFIHSRDKGTVDHITVTHKKNFLENIFLILSTLIIILNIIYSPIFNQDIILI